jgi:YD repeat-containing protein
MMAYGDRNNNTVWLARDTEGRLLGVVDATGHVLVSLHYTGDLLTEIRDYPRSGSDLPGWSARYEYDDKNRLITYRGGR